MHMPYYKPQQPYTPTNARKVIENFSYALNENIGKGFSSVVYKGKNDETGEPVAVKVIDKKGLKSPLHYALLKSEIETLAQLNSQNIMQLYKVYYTENNTYLITEYCDGGDLAGILQKQGPQRECYMQKLFAGIINGYKQMKMKGIVHRDIKPANVLLKQGLPKIADFGFATNPNSVVNMPNANVGSPLYMSPQAFKNRYSEKSDIWALGVTLFEMLFGQVPWQATSEKELAYKMATVPVQFPYAISNECRDLITHCLAVNEQQRFSVEDIERHAWIRPKLIQELQMIKGKGIVGKDQNYPMSPLSEAQNKAQQSSNSSQANYIGKENNTSTAMTGQKVYPTPQYIMKTQKRVRDSRQDSQVNPVNQSFDESQQYKRTEPFQSQRQHMMSLQVEITSDEVKRNDFVVLAQINYCRYLYRVAGLIDKHNFFSSQYIREKMMFLVNKNILVKISKLKDMMDGQNTLNLQKFNSYISTSSFAKLCHAIQQYYQKYSLQFNTIWLSLQNPVQKGILMQDKKFDAVFDDNFTEYESFYIILNSILRNGIKETDTQLQEQLNQGEQTALLPVEVEGGVVLLDYLITYFQLTCLIQECFDNHYAFAVDSKIEQIADGKPVRLTHGHYVEIQNKIKQLDI